jgi:hypothetical protein
VLYFLKLKIPVISTADDGPSVPLYPPSTAQSSSTLYVLFVFSISIGICLGKEVLLCYNMFKCVGVDIRCVHNLLLHYITHHCEFNLFACVYIS